MPRKSAYGIIGSLATSDGFHRCSYRFSAVIGCLIWLLGGCGGESSANRSPGNPVDEPVVESDADRDATSYRQRLLADPQDYEALFSLANILASQGKKGEAIELLSEIPPDHPEAGLASLGVSADWCMELQRYADAEQRYRQILESHPEVNVARRKLAHLLNRQGRRHEAVQLIRELCLAGDVMQDELHALIVEADAMYDEPTADASQNERLYLPIGPSGQARYLFTQRKYIEAVEILEPLIKSGTAPSSVVALYGFSAVEAQDDERFRRWLTEQATDLTRQFPEYWAAIGAHLLAESRFRESIRALTEAIRRDPTDLRSTRRLVQAFRSLRDEGMTRRWIERYAQLTTTLQANQEVAACQPPSTDAVEKLSAELDALGRRLEAILWRTIGASYRPERQESLAALNSQLIETVKSSRSFPSIRETLCGIDPTQFPLPEFGTVEFSVPKLPTREFAAGAARFEDIRIDIGLIHKYKTAVSEPQQAFAIYQQYGGGVAVIDYDLNGSVDLFFGQGAAAPPSFTAAESNQLFRTIQSGRNQIVLDVTMLSGTGDAQYSLGVTAGDWNQDGFPDLAVANIGTNLLLINNGDGTFRQQELDSEPSLTTMSTSLAMGDLTGDHLPDLIALNYIDDQSIAVRPPVNTANEVETPRTPFHYKSALDDLYTNDGAGGYQSSKIGQPGTDEAYGLGAVLSDFTGQDGNELFIGNDGTANQLWNRVPSSAQWIDQATALGCAFSSFGSPTASMGIATGDFDRSGTLDIHVTNFYHESSCLFLSKDGLFRDRNVQFRLDRTSWDVLGFGSQSLDYSNDGWLDLVVTNGHVDDLRWQNKPFRQNIQLFAGTGSQFESVAVADSSQYWTQPHLGRALARLDFNRDGKMDLVVTHLLEATALLLNRTNTQNHWIGLRIVGTKSERDAIGARVDVQAGKQIWSQWVTSGDGYLCKNDPTLIFGIGQQESVDVVTVTWPSGMQQEYRNLMPDRFVQLTEAEPKAYVFEPHDDAAP